MVSSVYVNTQKHDYVPTFTRNIRIRGHAPRE